MAHRCVRREVAVNGQLSFRTVFGIRQHKAAEVLGRKVLEAQLQKTVLSAHGAGKIGVQQTILPENFNAAEGAVQHKPCLRRAGDRGEAFTNSAQRLGGKLLLPGKNFPGRQQRGAGPAPLGITSLIQQDALLIGAAQGIKGDARQQEHGKRQENSQRRESKSFHRGSRLLEAIVERL